MTAPSYTHMARSMRPFLRVLRSYPNLTLPTYDGHLTQVSGGRGDVAQTEAMLRRIVELVGDEDLGLKAARAIRVGDFEVIEYMCSTAPTWRAALIALKRYFELVDQSISVELDLRADSTQLAFVSEVTRTRAGTDFLVGGIFVVAERWLSPLPDDLEICLRHAPPGNLMVYQQTFGGRRVCFGTAFDGLRFASKQLDEPLRTAEATVHALLRMRADQLLSELATTQDQWLARVRADLLSHLPAADISAPAVGKRLGMSPRTLARRLTDLGTSFSEQVQQLRKQLAEHYLRRSKHSVEEIAFLLGYSEAPPFVRAFNRWHGVSPGAYREHARRTDGGTSGSL